MQSEFARDLPDVDQPIRDAYEERPGKPIKMRLQPAVFRMPPGAKYGQYRSWRDVHWTLDFDSVEEAFAFREALRAFFVALNREGLETVTARLAGRKPKTPPTQLDAVGTNGGKATVATTEPEKAGRL